MFKGKNIIWFESGVMGEADQAGSIIAVYFKKGLFGSWKELSSNSKKEEMEFVMGQLVKSTGRSGRYYHDKLKSFNVDIERQEAIILVRMYVDEIGQSKKN